jgi:hypothetical protein
MSTQVTTSSNISMPRLFLHLEGLVILVGSLILYAHLDFKWPIFLLLLFVPDLPLLFYGIDKRFASVAYNIVHSFIFPLVLILFSYFNQVQIGMQISLIWLAHIGMDHAFGYGFKYLGQKKENHFSRI